MYDAKNLRGGSGADGGEPAPPLFWRAWTAPKQGHRLEENEDACRCDPIGAGGATGLLIALADGATEAVYSGLWARSLVAAARPDWPTLGDADLDERLNQVRRGFIPPTAGQPLPWYVRNKFLTQGSQATLLVATVAGPTKAAGLTVRAVAVGDCCLLLLRPGRDVQSFPLRTSADFGLDPLLVGSRPRTPGAYRRWQAHLGPDDVLLACTDAVGKWALQCLEGNRADLVLDLLLGLLAPAGTSSPETKGAGSRPPAPGAGLFGLLSRLWPRGRGHDGSEGQTPQACGLAGPGGSGPLEFEQLVDRVRTSANGPPLRNDDATLLACLPLGPTHGDAHGQALAVLRRHRAALAHPGRGADPINYPDRGADTMISSDPLPLPTDGD